MKIAITGHRPEKIPYPAAVKQKLRDQFEALDPDVVIVGMASGVDLWAAFEAHSLGIPYICAKPWRGHTARLSDMIAYNAALRFAAEVVNVTDYDIFPGAWVYQKRNEWMVDHADEVVAVWDGTSSGTANCVAYAKKVGKPVWRIHP